MGGGEEVYKSISLSELEKLKRLIVTAMEPTVTFNEDMEVMRRQRDLTRENNLAMMLHWVEHEL